MKNKFFTDKLVCLARYGELSKSMAYDRNADGEPLNGIFQKILEKIFNFIP